MAFKIGQEVIIKEGPSAGLRGIVTEVPSAPGLPAYNLYRVRFKAGAMFMRPDSLFLDPGDCNHPRDRQTYIGMQESVSGSPDIPLWTCRDCGTTITREVA